MNTLLPPPPPPPTMVNCPLCRRLHDPETGEPFSPSTACTLCAGLGLITKQVYALWQRDQKNPSGEYHLVLRGKS